jgi:uncharacterized membrane protein YjgN (DUF898 family)
MDISSPTTPVAQQLRFNFTGRTADYFGIWIVNLLLSIVTLGIYSAWAKVRRMRFLYGNTFIGGHALDYHARPIAILKGRLIVVAVIVVINLITQFYPLYGAGASVLLAFLVPFAIMLSLRFNARVTSWRNVRFDFDLVPRRDYFRGFLIFALMPVVAVLSLGLLLPVATRLSWNFVLRRLRFGRTPFTASIRLGPLYGALLGAVLLLIGVTILIGAIGGAVFYWQDFTSIETMFEDVDESELVLIMTFLPIIVGAIISVFAFAIAGTYYSALARNAVLGNTRLDGIADLQSRMSGLRMAWIAVSNTFAVLITVGLATPWATIRSWRYRTETLGAVVTGDIDSVIAADETAGTAIGAEWADIEGFDVGF